MGQEVKVSDPPVFDFDKAILAREKTEEEGYTERPVRTAGSLWLYNQYISSQLAAGGNGRIG